MLAAVKPKTTATHSAKSWYLNKWLLALLSGILLGISFPPSPAGWLIFIAFIPLLYITDTADKKYKIYLCAGIAVSIWFIIYLRSTFSLQTEFKTKLLLVGLYVIYAFATALLFLLYDFLRRKFSGNISSLLFLPVLWLLYEYLIIQGNAPLSPFLLKDAFNNHPFLFNSSRLGGNAILSLYILLSNILLYALLRKYAEVKLRMKFIYTLTGLHLIMFALNLLFSGERNVSGRAVVAAIQPNFNPYENVNEIVMAGRINRLKEISQQARMSGPKPDLYLWPESSVQGVMIDADSLDYNPVVNYIKNLASDLDAPVLTGALIYRLYKSETDATTTARKMNDNTGRYYDVFNAALFVLPEGRVQIHYKTMQLPFVEKVPFSEYIGRVDWLKISLGDAYPSYGQGENKALLKYKQLSIATIICSEIISPEYIRKMNAKGANLLAVISNEGWAGKAASNQQFNACIRGLAVQNERSVVKSSCNGPSVAVNSDGKIIRSLKYGEANFLISEVDLLSENNFYSRYGEIFSFVFIGILLSLIFLENYKNRFR
jgi:apolipoprotein N-acyltransferase